MKHARLVVFTTVISFCAFAAILNSSCTKDNCKGVLCQNGGTCSQGVCQCPIGYSGTFCDQSTIVYVNNTYTPVTITVNDVTHTMSALGGFTSFTGSAGSTVTAAAFTMDTAATGKQIGEKVSWTFTNNFPANSATLTVPVNVPSTYFYLKFANADIYAKSVSYITINYGSNYEVTDSMNIPDNGTIYRLGYYNALSNTKLYVSDSNGVNTWTINVNIADSLNSIATVVVP